MLAHKFSFGLQTIGIEKDDFSKIKKLKLAIQRWSFLTINMGSSSP